MVKRGPARAWTKGAFQHRGGVHAGAATTKTSMEALRNTNTELPYGPTSPLLGCVSGQTTRKDPRTPVFTSALFTAVTMQKQSKRSSPGEWTKGRCVYTAEDSLFGQEALLNASHTEETFSKLSDSLLHFRSRPASGLWDSCKLQIMF